MATRFDVARMRRRVGGTGAASGLALGAGVSGGIGGGVRERRDFAWLLGDWTPPADLVAPATEAQALALPAFGRGLALLAGTLAGVTWRAVRYDPDLGVDVRLPDQPAVLGDPDPLSTPWHYKWAAAEDLILHGNHFALFGELDWRTGRPGWLAPIAADEVWLLCDPNDPGLFAWTVRGQTLDPDEVLHVSAGNRSGEMLGRGVLRQYRDTLGGAVAAEDHAGGYFAGGALPPAVLQSPTVLTQDQADELKAKWRQLTRTREPVVLPTGYVLTPLVSNADAAQLVESRQWNAQAAAMMLGIPAWLLGLPGTSMTYQNMDQADIAWIKDSVDRWAQPMAASLSKWLMPRGTEVRWDYTSRLRADQKTTADVLSILVDKAIITVDEARAVLGRPPLAVTGEPGTTPAGVPELTPQEIT